MKLITKFVVQTHWKKHQTKKQVHGKFQFAKLETAMEYLEQKKNNAFRQMNIFNFKNDFTNQMEVSFLCGWKVNRVFNWFTYTNSNIECVNNWLSEIFKHRLFMERCQINSMETFLIPKLERDCSNDINQCIVLKLICLITRSLLYCIVPCRALHL